MMSNSCSLASDGNRVYTGSVFMVSNISWLIVTRFGAVFAVLPVVMLSVTVDMSAGACAILVLGSDCVVNILYAVESLTGGIIGNGSDIGADVDASGLMTGANALEITSPSPSEEPSLV